MYQGGTFLRQMYKHKPKQWGPFSAVQSALFYNAERVGIDPDGIALAMPMWEGGGIPHDYTYITKHSSITSYKWDNGFLPVNWIVNNPPKCWTGAFTIIAELDFAPYVYNVANQFIYHYNSGNRVYINVQQSSGNHKLDLVLGDTSSSSYTTTHVKGHATLVITADGSVADMFFRGVKGISDFAYTGLTTLSSIFKFNLNFASDMYAIRNLIIYAGSHNIDQINRLSENPWQLWQPVPQVFYSRQATGGSTLLPIKTINYNGLQPLIISAGRYQ